MSSREAEVPEQDAAAVVRDVLARRRQTDDADLDRAVALLGRYRTRAEVTARVERALLEVATESFRAAELREQIVDGNASIDDRYIAHLAGASRALSVAEVALAMLRRAGPPPAAVRTSMD